MQRSWVEIDVRQLSANIASVRGALPAAAKLVFVVKANAYGHGLREVARHAAREGVDWFSVAYVGEALAVRAVAPSASIVILGAVEPEDVAMLHEQSILPILVDEAHAERLSAAAARLGIRLKAHLKVDTGMGRFGVPWESAIESFARIQKLPGLELVGICTHFASVEVAPSVPGPRTGRKVPSDHRCRGGDHRPAADASCIEQSRL